MNKVLLLTGSLFLMVGLPSVNLWGQDFSLASRQADFKSFVHDFEDSYAYLGRPDKPWLTWEARYGPEIDKADSQEAFDTILASALSELHDFHAEVRSRVPDKWLPVPTFADIWAEFHGSQAVVTAIRQGSDAERAGIRVGDKVTAVGSRSLEEAIRERLTPAVDQQEASGRQWALLSVLTGRSDDARVLTVISPDGTSRTVTLPVERRFDRPDGLLVSKLLENGVGFIRFNNSLGEQKTVAAFDDALAKLRNTRGIIIDLRDVPSGGDSSIALGILGRFTAQVLLYQRHRIPRYGQSDVERNWVELVAPRGPFTYQGRVVVLVNHWTASMGEGIAIGFDAMQRGVVVGTPMAHLAGAVSDDKLPKTGVDVAFATEQVFHVNGTPRQKWVPPILVKENDGAPGVDPILLRGLAELGKEPRWPDVTLRGFAPAFEP